MRVAIIGCGTGGPAAALLLRRQGQEPVIFERVPDPKPVGAGLLIQPTGMRVLQELGLLDRAIALGSRIRRLDGRTSRGWQVIDLSYADLRPDLSGLGIQRGALFGLLWEAVHSAGIEVRTGEEIGGFEEREDGVYVAGERFDRLIVAGGARSASRPPGARVRPYPWGALWCVVQAEVWPDTLTQRFRDTREFIGLLPSGQGTTSLFWSIRADAVDAWRAAGLDAWKERARALMPEAPLDLVQSPQQMIFAPYFDVVAPRWHSGRVVWIGDAAHAMSPQLGQGANLALWDAWILSQCASLEEYSAKRKDHLWFYSLASRMLTPFFQSSIPWLAPARDLVAPPLHAWGWYRRQMLRSLAGVKTGPFSQMEIPSLNLYSGRSD